jgi:hypothetical protein
MGTLIRAITVPVGNRSKNFVIMIAIPETPPEAMLLGSRKQATPAANITDPKVSVKSSTKVLFSFFLSSLSILHLRKLFFDYFTTNSGNNQLPNRKKFSEFEKSIEDS